MVYQAEPRADIAEPPAYPVLWWLGLVRDGKWDGVSHTVVRCKTWFEARVAGMRTFKCEAHELMPIQGDRDSVNYGGTVYTLKSDTVSSRKVKTAKVKRK